MTEDYRTRPVQRQAQWRVEELQELTQMPTASPTAPVSAPTPSETVAVDADAITRILVWLNRSPALRSAVAKLKNETLLTDQDRALKAEDITAWLEAQIKELSERSTKSKDVNRRQRTLKGLIRNRAYRQRVKGGKVEYLPLQQPAFLPGSGTNRAVRAPIEHHDILVIAPKGVHEEREHYRFPVCKVEPLEAEAGSTGLETPKERLGAYVKPPELMDVYDVGQRHADAIGRPHEWGHAGFRRTERGPVLSTIPIKPEPGATSCVACYLLNTQNLNYRNAWTAEEWNDIPDGPDLPPSYNADATTLEALLAGPRGLVFKINLRNLELWRPGDEVRLSLQVPERQIEAGSIACVDLSGQMEVWQQLRNGCVVGRAMFDDEGTKRVVPLVNITTLTPE